MSMLRIIGAAVTVFSGIAAAYMLNGAARLTLCQNEAFISLVRFIRTEIECYATPVPRALERCPEGVLCACGYTGHGSPSSVSELAKRCKIYDSSTQKSVEGFAKSIGRGYREEQLALCDHYIDELENRRRVISAELPIRKKMNSALCVSGALAVVILLA